MVTKGGRNETNTQLFVSRDIETSSYFASATLPTACGCHHRLLDLVFIVVTTSSLGWWLGIEDYLKTNHAFIMRMARRGPACWSHCS